MVIRGALKILFQDLAGNLSIPDGHILGGQMLGYMYKVDEIKFFVYGG